MQQALGVIQRGVLHRKAAAEHGFQAACHLRGQADFRHKYQSRLPCANVFSISFKNTAVLPLPVTPCSNAARVCPLSKSCSSWS